MESAKNTKDDNKTVWKIIVFIVIAALLLTSFVPYLLPLFGI